MGELTWRTSLFLGRFYVSDVFRDLTYANPDLAYSYFNLNSQEVEYLSDFISKNKGELETFADSLIKKRQSTMKKFPITLRLLGEEKLFVFFKLYCGMFPQDHFLENTLDDAVSFGKYCEHIFSHYPNIHPVFSELIRYERRMLKEPAHGCFGEDVDSDQFACLFESPEDYRLRPQYRWVDSFDYNLLPLIKFGKYPESINPTFLLLDSSGTLNMLTRDMFDLIFNLVNATSYYNSKQLILNQFGLQETQLRKQVESLIEKKYLKVISKRAVTANV
ncbi:MAG: hypothetical protein CL521_02225 [Actinobacteria bacterium]|nr:hypothetical protein [Actinomycetota bacterium]